MNETEVRERAFAMPLTSPAFPIGPLPLLSIANSWSSPTAPIRKAARGGARAARDRRRRWSTYEFIRMPNSTGFGDYTESGQVIPVSLRGPPRAATRTACSSTTTRRSPAAARSGAFPRSWPSPSCGRRSTRWSAPCDYGSVLCATGTMGYKHREPTRPLSRRGCSAELHASRSSRMSTGTPRICELVRTT